ncbi:hypothetical protein BT96DRAFT_950063 [Gymnopus androsaceus JB14]|uniref:Cytochrome P450 n=1 Tax=Gymnopus androsaceus JB14 TaxID=1447944 RepID=A0A6A4GHM8_9AGAR|nr:hypothetical protein BT96DRAFT_950063 [Gymnopus androsaceus JB14]
MTVTSLNWQLGVIAILAIVLLRRVFRRKYGLDNLPGPVSPSWLTGNLLHTIQSVCLEVPRVIAKICELSSLPGTMPSNITSLDGSAQCHTVLVKNQDIFEEQDGFISFVLGPS